MANRSKVKKQHKQYKITNVVVTGNLGLDLDLYSLLYNLPKDVSVEYEPEQFPGAIVKLSKPKVTVLVFKNGKVVVVGAKDIELIKKTLDYMYDLLKPLAKSFDKKIKKGNIPFQITNYVASGDVGMSFDLFEVALELEDYDIEYEPEQFPGAIIRLPHYNITVLLFKNGKVILAGSPKDELISKALEEIKSSLRPYAKEIHRKRKK